MTALTVRVFVEKVPVGRDHNHDLLRRAVASAAGCDAGDVDIVRRCVHCGGDHGKARIVHPVWSSGDSLRAGGRWETSLARTPGLVAVAVCGVVPVGVDIESVALVRRAPIDGVAFHPAELAALAELDAASPMAGQRARARLWTRKESLLKATGDGLHVEPSLIRMTVPGSEGKSGPRLLTAPDTLGPVARVRIVDLELGDTVVGAVSALTDRPLTIELEHLSQGQDLPCSL